VALHQGDVTGSLLSATWAWSDDDRSLTFTPATQLAPKTNYTLPIGGGRVTGVGQPMGFQAHGQQMGGQWATRVMLGGGMGTSMMGPGWRDPNSMYGLTFAFTTV
jgi:hypothetical protein